jgi:hypothetical protein
MNVSASKSCQCGKALHRPDGMSDRKWACLKRCPDCDLQFLAARIESRISVDQNGCWIWPGATAAGYGRVSFHDHPQFTHRVMYLTHVGAIHDGMEVCHFCDVRLCCNPEHLFAGTRGDNMADAKTKGRLIGKNLANVRRGLAHPAAKLPPESVIRIRELVSSGKHQREVAAMFGCSQSTIWRIAHGRTRTQA